MNTIDKERLDNLIKNTIQCNYEMTAKDENELRDMMSYIKHFLYVNRNHSHHKIYAHAKLLYKYIDKNLKYYSDLRFNNKLIPLNDGIVYFDIPMDRPRLWE
jgi:hypothetical protein